MPTRKELHDQARSEQRSRSLVTRSDNPKSAIVGIGDRDPKTGQYQVLLPDGSTSIGEKVFNSSLPNGSQVLGIPKETGGWLLDERDVKPIKPLIQAETYGKIKVLFSTIEGSDRVFWVGGDRPKPKRIYSIPSSDELQIALISNAGNGDKFFVALRHGSQANQKITISSRIQIVVPPIPIGLGNAAYGYAEMIAIGHGFWTQAIGSQFLGTPLESFSINLVSTSQFLQTSREVGGSIFYDLGAKTQIGSSQNAISPAIDKLSSIFSSDTVSTTPIGYSSRHEILNIDRRDPLFLGKGATSAIYEFTVGRLDSLVYGGFIFGQTRPPNVVSSSVSIQTIFVDCATQAETILGGDLGFRDQNLTSFSLANLIRQKVYVINFGRLLSYFGATFTIPTADWDVTKSKRLNIDTYNLGANTTKIPSSAKVFALTSGARVHSISYHP